jgi:hypothetical protein
VVTVRILVTSLVMMRIGRLFEKMVNLMRRRVN